MKICRLSHQNFRSLQGGSFAPGDGINVIYGKNAQGKTNLLEAIWLFTGGRSFRGSKDADLVAFETEKASLSLVFDAGEREQTAEITIANGRRSAVLNGVEQRSAAGLVGNFCAVIFSPEHLSLVKDGPSMRRIFLDSALCQIRPAYARLLSQYQRILSQRNALLKDIPRHSELLDTLDIWDQRIADFAAEVTRMREWYAGLLEQPAKEVYHGISREKELFSLSYASSAKWEEQKTPKAFFQAFQAARSNDLAAGFTTIGPHRDDLELQINGLSARSFGSQGQQRSAVLALKLAEARILTQQTGEAAVILLDDVMSELDTERQDYLLNHLQQHQVLITCCEPESIRQMKGGQRFEMKAGVLSPME